MKNQKVRIRRRRRYSVEFKRQIVSEYERGKMTVYELEKFYDISNVTIYSWVYKYSNYNKKSIQVVEHKNSQVHRLKELEAKVQQLERIVGQKQMNIEYLEKMIELAKEHYDIDIKKNFNTPHSSGSKPTEKS